MAGGDARRHRTRESTIMLSSLVLTWFSGDHSSFKKSIDDLDLVMNVLESHRAFFMKNDHLATEVLTLT